MACATGDLSVLAYADGFTLWHCKASAASQAELLGAGFFDPAADLLATGDMIVASARDGGRLLCVLPGEAGVSVAPMV